MKTSAWIVLLYALIILLGGIIGFREAHSLPSLIAGSVSAILLLLCASGMFKKSVLAYTFSIIFIMLLTCFFGYRFMLTSKFMPSGMMLIVSALALIFVLRQRKRKTKLI